MERPIRPEALLYASPVDREERVDVLHDAIDQVGLATLVTAGEQMLHATHLPILLDRIGTHGIIRGHVARGNLQWSDLNATMPALAIFRLASAYISPSWYETKTQTGKVVPTYDYIAIHAAGSISFFDDPVRLLAIVEKLTQRFEAQFEMPWSVNDAPPDYIASMLKGIVGFELHVESLTGSFKLSQGRNQADRDGAVEGLSASTRPEDRVIAALISNRPHP